MNTEKLDDLASQAGFDVARLRAPHPGGFPREDMLALESFAELIVWECIDIVEKDLVVNLTKAKTDDEGKIWTNAQLTFSEMIKRRFGVEL